MIDPRDLGPIIKDPVKFQHGFLTTREGQKRHKRRLWPVQEDILDSIRRNVTTNVKGCHASGKTDVVSGEALRWIVAEPDSLILVIAPTLRQVKTFIGEVELKRQGAAELGLAIPECTTTALKVGPDHYLQGFSASRGVNVQGYHGRKVFAVVDEAPGVGAEVMDALDGIRAGGDCTTVNLGNPVVPSGPFHDAFKHQAPGVRNITISAFDTPNLIGVTLEELLAARHDDPILDVCPRPYLARRRWVREMAFKWGVDSPKFQSRVLGLFPQQGTFNCFPLAWIERAQRDPREAEQRAARSFRIQVGLDVAGGGDDETVIYAQVEGIILRFGVWTVQDPFNQILHFLRGLERDFPEYGIGHVVVDIVGLGLHLAKRIAEKGYSVWGVQAGATARNPRHYANQKSEIYWHARELLEADLIAGLTDRDTRDQLADVLYAETNEGRIYIESKKDAKKRGLNYSPDRAEAFILSVMPIIPEYQGLVIDEPYVIGGAI